MVEKKYVSDNAQLMTEWDLEKNSTLGFSPDLISLGSGRSVWWLCPKGHSYQMTVNKKATRNFGCPICSGYKIVAGINDFATYYPDLAKEWHPTKNGDKTPFDFSVNSQKNAWFICAKCHNEYESRIAYRAKRISPNCPICKKIKIY